MAGPKEMDIRNEAFLVCAEWGPPRRTPRDQRLAECFPAVSEQEREAWLQEFKQVEDEIWKMAEEGGQSRHTRAAVIAWRCIDVSGTCLRPTRISARCFARMGASSSWVCRQNGHSKSRYSTRVTWPRGVFERSRETASGM